MNVAVVVPTISSRAESLDRCIRSYLAAPSGVEVVIERNWPTCGEAWNHAVLDLLSNRLPPDYIHLTADDIEAHPGWLAAGVARIEAGATPAARILHGDGTLQSCGDEHDRPEGFVTEIARIPLLTAAQAAAIFPIPAIHYFTDNIVSDRLRTIGVETVVTRDYLFTHHLAGEGRLDRLALDHNLWIESRT